MAEEWHLAFGRYLRTLRGRRNLSLQEVASLSQSFPDTLNKGYLSRCENGRQSLAFSKAIPLSRIYKVPADVLLERMELDLELDVVGGPDTEGMGFAELTAAGRETLRGGDLWRSYGYLRDALARAFSDPVKTTFRDRNEQIGSACQNAATGARTLGRYHFALHEYMYVKDADLLGPRLYPVLLDRLATVHTNLGDLARARSFGDQAIIAAEEAGDYEFLGNVYCNRGVQAHADEDSALAISLYEKAYRCFRDADRKNECAIALNNLAQVQFDLGRFGTARRSLEASLRTTRGIPAHRSQALAHILLGEIEERQGREEHATRHWKRAAADAKQVNDKIVRFKADYLLMKQAHRTGNQAVTRAIERRLRKLANYIPDSTAELREFEKFIASDAAAS